MIEIGALPGNSHFFINLTTEGQALRFYGTKEKLAKHPSAIGKMIAPLDIVDGLRLDLHCRVRTIRISDLTLVQRLLPAQSRQEE